MSTIYIHDFPIKYKCLFQGPGFCSNTLVIFCLSKAILPQSALDFNSDTKDRLDLTQYLNIFLSQALHQMVC